MTTAIELKHPNITAIYAAEKEGDTCWYAMEYVDGEPLTKLIEKFGTLKMVDWRFALTVGVQIAQRLEIAMRRTSFTATSRGKASWFELSIPDKFQDVVMMVLAKRPELRYQTPAQAARALEQVAKYQGITTQASSA